MRKALIVAVAAVALLAATTQTASAWWVRYHYTRIVRPVAPVRVVGGGYYVAPRVVAPVVVRRVVTPVVVPNVVVPSPVPVYTPTYVRPVVVYP